MQITKKVTDQHFCIHKSTQLTVTQSALSNHYYYQKSY